VLQFVSDLPSLNNDISYRNVHRIANSMQFSTNNLFLNFFSTGHVNFKALQQEMQNNAESQNKVMQLTEISILSNILESI
jgi:hypothetical protein